MPLLSIRNVNALIVLGCASMMLIAWLYFQNFLKLAPCPLCMTQRGFVVLVGIFAALAWLQNPKGLGRRIYAGLGIVSGVLGAIVAGRHTWLQTLPEDQQPACGPSLEYMFDVLPFMEALQLLFQGDGNCADIQWSLLGLSIPGWTLVAFIGLIAINCWQLVRRDLPWH